MAKLKLKFTGFEEGKLYRRKDYGCTFRIVDGVLFYGCGEDSEEINFDDWDIDILLHSEYEKVKPKLIDTQIKVLEGRLAERFEWIIKDENGGIFVYSNKPTKHDICWNGVEECSLVCIDLDFLS